MLLGSLLIHGLVFMMPTASENQAKSTKTGEKTEIKSEKATQKPEVKSKEAAKSAKTHS